ncbi:MAG: protoporphyrinogen/coproporphyrinogen oxidase [Acidobacteriota bacterium]|jgi:oxygen-dependent protoporphyrinogen oxidase|nr:protoporphyrinogen/coproporphyrinogen oxidase [Acidobacteriota bacterium]
MIDTLVIGAGISGLTTAFHLARGGQRVVVLEASPRVGGSLETRTDGPWRFELGPNTVLESHQSVTRLIREAGLESEKVTASSTAKRRYLWKGGRLHPLPSGPLGFLRTPLFPASAKLRLLREPWIPKGDSEESIATFVRRRLGRAFLDYAVGPFVSGVYAGDPERLSVRHAVPRIADLEREHGSLIRGAFASKGAGPRGAMFSFREGMEQLPRELARQIGDVRTGVACRRIVRTVEGFRAETDSGPVEASRVVLSVPADVAARLLEREGLAEIPYAPVSLVSTGWRREDVAHPLDGFGFLAPRKEGLRVLGVLFPSEIFPGRAPAGHVVLTAFAGGRTDPEVTTWDEDRLMSEVLGELRRTVGVRGEPVISTIRRWPRAIPQYELGHGRFLDMAHEAESALPGLRIGGNFLRGVSVPDCIRNATALAEELLQR